MAHLRCDFFSEALSLSTSMTVLLPQRTTTQIGMEGRTPDGAAARCCTCCTASATTTRSGCAARRSSATSPRSAWPSSCRRCTAASTPTRPTAAATGRSSPRSCPSWSARFFRVSDRREDTFVAGLSMGGYGALKWALRQPERFAAAASLSGALDIAGLRTGRERPEDPRLFERIFGDREPGRRTTTTCAGCSRRPTSRPCPPLLRLLRHRGRPVSTDNVALPGRGLVAAGVDGDRRLRARRPRLGLLGRPHPGRARLAAAGDARRPDTDRSADPAGPARPRSGPPARPAPPRCRCCPGRRRPPPAAARRSACAAIRARASSSAEAAPDEPRARGPPDRPGRRARGRRSRPDRSPPAAGRRGPRRRPSGTAAASSAAPRPHQRVHDAVEPRAGLRVGEDDRGEGRPVQRPVRRSARCSPKASTTAASPGVPGSTTSRAIRSASITTAPRAGQERRHGALARSDPAGQPDAQHVRTVASRGRPPPTRASSDWSQSGNTRPSCPARRTSHTRTHA